VSLGSLNPRRRWQRSTLGPAGLVLTGLLCVGLPSIARGQHAAQWPSREPAAIDTTLEAGEADDPPQFKRPLDKFNNFNFGWTTFRYGYGALVDFVGYSQDEAAKQQTPAESDIGLRDARLLSKGKFATKRSITWTMGIMYDGPTKSWFLRQTGLMIAVPEISSHFFIGRTKEGYSMYKHMVGYDIWTIERSPFLDAFIPILGDGIKWIGAAPKARLSWQLAYFGDAISEDEKFSTYDHQVVGRLVWLPMESDARLLHIAIMGRDTKPDNGQFQPRSRPESFLSPYYVDAGKFPSDHAQTAGFEAYYRNGPWLFGGEYGWQFMDAPTAGDPTFNGGNVSAVWLITGETRGYNNVSNYFNGVHVKKSVFDGGPGAMEAALNYSYIDLNGGNRRGGTFWRVTPSVKWHLIDYIRVELAYGYGRLDRFDLKGTTNFFQGRFIIAY
jgi:phosphate-selective porin OprO/OprP